MWLTNYFVSITVTSLVPPCIVLYSAGATGVIVIAVSSSVYNETDVTQNRFFQVLLI